LALPISSLPAYLKRKTNGESVSIWLYEGERGVAKANQRRFDAAALFPGRWMELEEMRGRGLNHLRGSKEGFSRPMHLI
jgi:hypothetical protein